MTIEQFLVQMIQVVPLLLLKIFVIVLLFLHVLFAFVITRQTKAMIRVVEVQISPAIYTISIVHFLSSIFVLVWTIIFL